MPRLFTAIELSEACRSAVATEQQRLVRQLRERGDRHVRPVRPHQLHLTLVFIGEVPDADVANLVEVMQPDLPLAPFDLAFSGVGLFPPRGPANVLWLGVEPRSRPDVQQLFELVADRLEVAGVSREARVFTPHLTLGRWRTGGPSSAPVPVATAGNVATERVVSVTLFESRLLPGGAEHTPLAYARLTGSAPALH